MNNQNYKLKIGDQYLTTDKEVKYIRWLWRQVLVIWL